MTLQTCGLPTEENIHTHNSLPQSGHVWFHRTACWRHHCGRKIEKCDTSINTYPRITVKICCAYGKWLISWKQNLVGSSKYLSALVACILCSSTLINKNNQVPFVHNFYMMISSNILPRSHYSMSRSRGYHSLTSDLLPITNHMVHHAGLIYRVYLTFERFSRAGKTTLFIYLMWLQVVRE